MSAIMPRIDDVVVKRNPTNDQSMDFSIYLQTFNHLLAYLHGSLDGEWTAGAYELHSTLDWMLKKSKP